MNEMILPGDKINLAAFGGGLTWETAWLSGKRSVKYGAKINKNVNETMKYIQSGNSVIITGAAGELSYLVLGMVENKHLYKNLEII